MGLENVPRCRHVKVNGIQCGSPALRRRRYCFFHNRMLDRDRRFAQDTRQRSMFFSMRLLEDANSVQVALMQVMTLLGAGQMEPKIAGLLLYGLQTASSNLKRTNFEPEKSTDIVINRDTVDQTCINGPQWFTRDFPDEAEPKPAEAKQPEIKEENNEENHKETVAATAVSGKAPVKSQAQAKPRKKPEVPEDDLSWLPEPLRPLMRHPGGIEAAFRERDAASETNSAEPAAWRG